MTGAHCNKPHMRVTARFRVFQRLFGAHIVGLPLEADLLLTHMLC